MTADQNPGIVPDAVERATETSDSTLAPTVDPAARAEPVDAIAPTPDLGRTAQAMVSPRGRSIEATILTGLAVLYSLYFAREFLVPIVFALLLNFLLSPVIRRMVRWHIKPPISAALVVVLLITAVAERFAKVWHDRCHVFEPPLFAARELGSQPSPLRARKINAASISIPPMPRSAK